MSTRKRNDLTTNGPARAVFYLRVSTKEQAERGGASEGFSIPAQRQACERKAESLGADIVDEFVDRGESAKTADRPELQRMLEFIAHEHVNYVIVHKVDRLARNRADDVTINMAIQSAGASLVSCTENIDETPSGALMHGIMSSIAEFYSRNLANEVLKGSTQKAMAGGTIGKAPTGYINVRKLVDHHEVRSVEIDPERGPLMRWVFEQYATGEWSVRRLLQAATDKGLLSTGGPRTPSKPLSLGNFNRLLRSDYYIGVVTYRGVKYPGSHKPLISEALFLQVQAVLAAHAASGEKVRKYHHYLKGTVFCAECGSRLSVSMTKNRHGVTYPYFVCIGRGRKRTDCQMKAILIPAVEDEMIRAHHEVSLTRERIAEVEAFIHAELSVSMKGNAEEHERQQRRIDQLLAERQKLLQAHYADAISLDQLRDEQTRITAGLSAARAQLAKAEVSQEQIERSIHRALSKLEDLAERYEIAGPKERREMNQAVYERVGVGAQARLLPKLAEEYELLIHADVLEAARNFAREQAEGMITDLEKMLATAVGSVERRTPAFAGRGSENDWLVGAEGLEPPTTAL